MNRVLAGGSFPDNLEELGRTTRAVVDQYREYVALIYVDVVEFDGSHIRKFYEDMAQRFERFLHAHDMDASIGSRLAPILEGAA